MTENRAKKLIENWKIEFKDNDYCLLLKLTTFAIKYNCVGTRYIADIFKKEAEALQEKMLLNGPIGK